MNWYVVEAHAYEADEHMRQNRLAKTQIQAREEFIQEHINKLGVPYYDHERVIVTAKKRTGKEPPIPWMEGFPRQRIH